MPHERTRRRLGDEAEQLVADFLENQGICVVSRNVRLGYLEIDIVAREGPVIAIVEVRRRGSTARTTGFSSFNQKKRRRIRWAGERLWNRVYKFDPTVERMRFDAASVSFSTGLPHIEYVRAAF
jgi:putative endonuclease